MSKPAKRKQEDRRQDAEAKLLDAAVELVAERGYDRFTLADVGEMAQFSRGLPAHYFGSKDNLLSIIAERIVSLFLARLDERGTAGGGLEPIAESLRHIVQRTTERQLPSRALPVIIGAALVNPGLAASVKTLNDAGIDIEVKAGLLARSINLLNKIGLGWFFYFAYYLWQKKALKAAQEIIKAVDIDIVHQLGPIGYREPGFLSKLNKPMVWGPIGGMKIMDDNFISMLPYKAKIKFTVKNYINRYQLGYSGRIKAAFKNADVIISATLAGQNTIRDLFKRESYYLPEQGVTTHAFASEKKNENMRYQVQLVWSGSLIERKNLKMCLDSLADVKKNNWVLHVLGDGPLRKVLKDYAIAKGLSSNVIFHGHLPRNEAVNMMAAANLHLITSISEDNPAVIFEAMSNGVPTLTIDHCGMGDVICNKCGVKILPASYDTMVKKMAAIISYLLSNTQILADMSQTTSICANEHKWDRRLIVLNKMYEEAIRVHNHPIDYTMN